MDPDRAIDEARQGTLRPVYLLLGTERFLVTKVLEALRAAVIGDHDLGLNEEHLVAGEVTADRVISAARTLPMMAPRRLVVVRDCERWETKSDAKGKGKASKSSKATTPLDALAEYAASPADSTVLVLQAGKLDARRRLVAAAKKSGYLVACDAPAARALPGWVQAAAKRRSKRMGSSVASLLAELAGPELSALDDAVERLALFVGQDDEITEDALAECIVQVKPSTVWELVDAVGRRDRGGALTSLAKVYDPQDRGLRLLGVLAWSTRQLVKFSSARREGLGSTEAAKRAGVPPFKAGQLDKQASQLRPADLERWLGILARVDLELKGGSRRPPRATLEAAVIDLCGAPRKQRAGR